MRHPGQSFVMLIFTSAGTLLVSSATRTAAFTEGSEQMVGTASTSEVATDQIVESLQTTPTIKRLTTQTELNLGKFGRLNESSLSSKRANCFQAANLSQSMTSFTCNTSLLVHYSLTEFWTHHASLRMCQKRDAYGEVMECVLNATKGCLPPSHRLHFPDGSKARGGLNYICDVSEAAKFDVNITCAQIHFPKVFDCVHSDMLLVLGNASIDRPIQPHLICRTFDIADLCCWEKLQVCGKETAGAYTRLMSHYLRPPSCLSSASPSTANMAAFLLSLVLSLKMLS